MPDKHLNIYYSYNRDMGEDNMTRALIVTLKMVSTSTKKLILSKLLEDYLSSDFLANLENIDFALQGNIPVKIEKLRKIPNRYVISLTGHSLIVDEDRFKSQEQDDRLAGHSSIRPDAWIYDGSKDPRYCFLLECKTIEAELKASQIIAYASRFFGMKENSEIDKKTIRLTWFDVVGVLSDVISNKSTVNEEESKIIGQLIDYLGFFDIVPFRGLSLANTPVLPQIEMPVQGSPVAAIYGFSLGRIPRLPTYQFLSTQ